MSLDIIKALKDFLQIKRVQTTSFIFKLITKYSVNIFLTFILLLGAKNLFGDPIECYGPNASNIQKAMEMNCWLEGLHIDKNLLNGERGNNIINYGVGPLANGKTRDFVHLKFYQWIVPLLLLQALCLYFPRAIWRFQERGGMMSLLNDIYYPVLNEEWSKRKHQLVAYVRDVEKKYHRQFALKYLICEFMTIVVIILNMFTLNLVITNFWSEYEPAVVAILTGNFANFNREAARLFPTQAMCTFYDIGSSGTLQEYNPICILPQNVVNEKIFVVVYVWYIIILILAILNFLYLIMMYSSSILRVFNIGHMLERTVTIRECKEISSNGDIGLWFTLSIYRKNMVSIYFQDLCKELKERLKQEKTLPHSEYEDIDKYS